MSDIPHVDSSIPGPEKRTMICNQAKAGCPVVHCVFAAEHPENFLCDTGGCPWPDQSLHDDDAICEPAMLDLEAAADAVAQARLDWFKAQRELGRNPAWPKHDVCFYLSWSVIQGIADGMGIDFKHLDRSAVSASIRRQIDIKRIIRVALADAYEKAQQ